MNALVGSSCASTARADQELNAGKGDDILTLPPILGSFSGRIQSFTKPPEVAMFQVQADFEPIFAASIGFGGGSISDITVGGSGLLRRLIFLGGETIGPQGFPRPFLPLFSVPACVRCGLRFGRPRGRPVRCS